jgi:hypothetical protein
MTWGCSINHYRDKVQCGLDGAIHSGRTSDIAITRISVKQDGYVSQLCKVLCCC